MPFQRSCLYHPSEKMRVIEADNEAEYRRLVDTGMWFDNPNKAKEFREKKNEKPIRQRTR